MNSIDNIINISKLTKEGSIEENMTEYNSSLKALESVGYKVLRYSVNGNIENISDMIFNKDISPRDVSFDDNTIRLTEKALSGLMRRVSVDFERLKSPIVSEFSGDYPLNDLDYYADLDISEKQSPVVFLQNKMESKNKARPSI